MPLVGKNKKVTERLEKVAVNVNGTLGELRDAVAAALRLSKHRIELRKFAANRDKLSRDERKNFPTYADDRKTLKELGIAADTQIEVKDLGPQFSYRGVFLVEYAGPILIILWYATRPAIFFGDKAKPVDIFGALSSENAAAPAGSAGWNSFVQALAIGLWVLHFLKRELETLFVHKFSRATMPLFNLFKNSIYYWGFAAAVGYPLVHPGFTAPGKEQVAAAVALWFAAQATNFAVHAQLSGMRKTEGDKDRKAPGGALFALVSCPNYTAEVLGWVAWTIATQIMMSGLFTLAGLAQMTEWALSKHRGYIGSATSEEEKKKMKRRKAIIPFVI